MKLERVLKLFLIGVCCVNLIGCENNDTNSSKSIDNTSGNSKDEATVGVEEITADEVTIESEEVTVAELSQLDQSCIEVVLDKETHINDDMWDVDVTQPKLVLKEGVNHPILQKTIESINDDINKIALTEHTAEIANTIGSTPIKESMDYEVIRSDEENFVLIINYVEPYRGNFKSFCYPIDLTTGESLGFNELFEHNHDNYRALVDLIADKAREKDGVYQDDSSREAMVNYMLRGDNYNLSYYYEESGNLHVVLNNGYFYKAISTMEISISPEELEAYHVELSK